MNSVTLTPEQANIVDEILTDDPQYQAYFITGPAGTGKSTVLKEIQRRFSLLKKQFVVLAPTGIAAINVAGQTIHSFFKFPPRLLRFENPEDIHKFSQESQRRKIFESLEYLIIDEISMVRVDIMDAIDFSLRRNRDSKLPFGGVKLIMFGDLLQLEPVVLKDERAYIEYTWRTPFFFSARVWDIAKLKILRLTTILRQAEDKHFAKILKQVRKGDKFAFYRLQSILKKRIFTKLSKNEDAIILTPYKKVAKRINKLFLESLPGKMVAYDAKIQGDIKESDMPVDKQLALKQGAKVMLTANDQNKRFINGDIALIEKLNKDTIIITLERTGKSIEITPHVWEKYQFSYDEEQKSIIPQVVGQYIQFPLRLAWAITIHKSQGLTLDKVKILLGKGTFAHGQLYVALSRCRKIDDIQIDRVPILADFKIRPEVIDFLENIGGA